MYIYIYAGRAAASMQCHCDLHPLIILSVINSTLLNEIQTFHVANAVQRELHKFCARNIYIYIYIVFYTGSLEGTGVPALFQLNHFICALQKLIQNVIEAASTITSENAKFNLTPPY